MLLPVEVDGLEAFLKEAEKHAGKTVFALFTGSDDPATGGSWCPDCKTAEPVIEKGIEKASDDAVFILCTVGDRDTWKNPQNEFRTHSKFQLKGIPTLVKWGTPQKLGPEECAKEDLVTMLFEDN